MAAVASLPALPSLAAVASMQAPSCRQLVVNTTALRLHHPGEGPNTLSLSAALSRAARGEEAEQQGLGWHGAGPCPQGWQGVSATCRRAAALPVPSQAVAEVSLRGQPCRGPPHAPSAVDLGLILPRHPSPVATPFPAAAPIPSPAPGAERGSAEKPSSYRSTMSAMVQANMRSPSGICRATGKEKQPRG